MCTSATHPHPLHISVNMNSGPILLLVKHYLYYHIFKESFQTFIFLLILIKALYVPSFQIRSFFNLSLSHLYIFEFFSAWDKFPIQSPAYWNTYSQKTKWKKWRCPKHACGSPRQSPSLRLRPAVSGLLSWPLFFNILDAERPFLIGP